MKHLKLIFVSLIILGSLNYVEAKTKDLKTTNKTIVLLKKSPNKVYVYKGKTYRFRSGKWFIKRGRKFIAVRPPVGIQVRTLPRGNKIVKVNGRKLYKYNGIWYKKNRRGFVVVNI